MYLDAHDPLARAYLPCSNLLELLSHPPIACLPVLLTMWLQSSHTPLLPLTTRVGTIPLVNQRPWSAVVMSQRVGSVTRLNEPTDSYRAIK
jgi:hypothetical protein